ncbi:hypothetical protein [Streptococcus parauberis]|uniref:hypothetical protein n=1 Tax=Streptococcus parauberis TaxID=1348 RepID=UPI0002DAFBCC|nr:hypothetical protein [Streptococcus parauberis]QBX17856.1 hypothetical protein Javan383_0011 [Streptococcus phage Javan383]UWM90179.1 hypothetical protein N2A94_06675 [Streptococcus parauberis]
MEDKEIIIYNGNQYELKYNAKTVETAEAITGKSFMATVVNSKGMLSIGDLRQYFINALYAFEGGRVAPAQGAMIFDELLNTKGFVYLNMLVISTIQRDCPFFFLGD